METSGARCELRWQFTPTAIAESYEKVNNCKQWQLVDFVSEQCNECSQLEQRRLQQQQQD